MTEYFGTTAEECEAYTKDTSKCPYCKSENIESKGIHRHDPYAYIIKCLDCYRTYLEILSIDGYMSDQDGVSHTHTLSWEELSKEQQDYAWQNYGYLFNGTAINPKTGVPDIPSKYNLVKYVLVDNVVHVYDPYG